MPDPVRVGLQIHSFPLEGGFSTVKVWKRLRTKGLELCALTLLGRLYVILEHFGLGNVAKTIKIFMANSELLICLFCFSQCCLCCAYPEYLNIKELSSICCSNRQLKD